MCQQNTTKIRPERGVQLFGQSYQKITMDFVGEINSEWPLVYPPNNSSTTLQRAAYLSNRNLSKCKIHPILKHRCYSSLDISRIPVKLRPVTGTYVLQTKRIKYYRNVCILSLSLSRSFVLLICNLNINLLDRPSSLAMLAEFFLIGFTLIPGHMCCKQNALSTTEMKMTQPACYAEQLNRMYYTSFSNVKNYSRRE
jgi:hypothetical protein